MRYSRYEQIEEVQSLISARVADALLAVDKQLAELPYRAVGGHPEVSREAVFGVINSVASEMLGDGWPALLRLAAARRHE